jgi:amino acid adenylation domain-containing protein
MIGLFINTIPIRIDIPTEMTVNEWLKSLHSKQIARDEYNYLPLVDIHSLSELSHDVALIDSLLVFENYPINESTSETEQDKQMSISELNHHEEANYNFSIIAVNNKTLQIKLAAKGHLITDAELKQLSSHLKMIVLSMLQQQQVRKLSMLSKQEHHYLLHSLNNTKTDYAQELCIHQVFELQVKKHPDNIAVAFAGQSLTYSELNTQANQLAHYLIEKGEKGQSSNRIDSIIGLCFDRSLEMMVALMAILKSGAAYLPLDPNYPKARLEYMIKDSGLSMLLTQQHLAGKTDEIIDGHSRQSLIIDNQQLKNTLSSYSSNNPIVKDLNAHNLAYVIYTSGSTGQPKGVMNEHQALHNLCQWHKNEYQVTADKTASHLASIGFDAAVWEIWPYLISGASIQLISDQTRVTPDELLKTFKQNKVTHCFLPTALLEASYELFDTAEHTPLEFILTGGDKLTKQGFVNTTTCLVNHYGPTESAVVTTSQRIHSDENTTPPIGKPIANIRTYVLAHDLSLMPNKTVGELYIAGAGLARGYLNQTKLTEQCFIQHSFTDNTAERLYKTGDLVRYLADGSLEFIGRIDHQVKIRGFRIELGEIEHQILEYPDVNSVVVIVHQNKTKNENLLAAFITLNTNESEEKNTITAIKNSLKTMLPDYMIPSSIMILDKLPVTENGKIDIKSLPDIDWKGSENKYLPATTEHEIIMQTVLSDVLAIDKQIISMNDSFFEIGGNSLSLLRAMNELKKAGLTVSIKQFYEYKTLKEICQNNDKQSYDTLVKLNDNQSKNTPLYFLHPMGGRVDCYKEIAEYLTEICPVYGVQAPFIFNQDFQFTDLKQLASFYAQAIIKNQPKGPYRLAGWSVGGLMTQQVISILHDSGRQVEYFAGIDSFMSMLAHDDKSQLGSLKRAVEFSSKHKPLNDSYFPKNMNEKSFSEQLSIAAELLLKESSEYISKEQLMQGLKFGTYFFQAEVSLSPVTVNGKVTLVIASENDQKDVLINEWQQYVIPEASQIEVKGEHSRLMEGESIRLIKEILMDDLNGL